jgi:hypothetical protein
MSLKFAFLLI